MLVYPTAVIYYREGMLVYLELVMRISLVV